MLYEQQPAMSNGQHPDVRGKGLDASQAVDSSMFITKRLTSSDSNGAGRVVIPKAAAEAYFPRITSTSGTKLNFMDTFGDTHALQLRFWDNKASKIYILEGLADVQRKYQIGKGDTIIFSKTGDGETLLVRGEHGWAPEDKAANDAAFDKIKLSADRNSAHRKRRKLANPTPSPLATMDVQYRVDIDVLRQYREDGVFRTGCAKGGCVQAGVSRQGDHRWVAVLDLAGEPYQAFFSCETDAVQAFQAAGGEKLIAK